MGLSNPHVGDFIGQLTSPIHGMNEGMKLQFSKYLTLIVFIQASKWMEKAENIKAYLDIQNLNTKDTSVAEEEAVNNVLGELNQAAYKQQQNFWAFCFTFLVKVLAFFYEHILGFRLFSK